MKSEQNGYHTGKYCLRGFFVSLSMKLDWVLLGFLILFMSACGNGRVSDEPVVSTVEVQVSDNFSFYYLPRVLSVFNESMVFLNIESNCLSVYSTRNGTPITHFTIDDIELENVYTKIIDLLNDSSLLSYQQIRTEELFKSRIKFSTFIKQDRNSFVAIITVPFLTLGVFEYNGEIVVAKLWKSEYAAIELKLIGSEFVVEEVSLIAAESLPENTGLNFKSSFASNRKSILLPLNSIVFKKDRSRKVLFRNVLKLWFHWRVHTNPECYPKTPTRVRDRKGADRLYAVPQRSGALHSPTRMGHAQPPQDSHYQLVTTPTHHPITS